MQVIQASDCSEAWQYKHFKYVIRLHGSLHAFYVRWRESLSIYKEFGECFGAASPGMAEAGLCAAGSTVNSRDTERNGKGKEI